MNWTYLFLLACPIGMGLMMWMMMRGNGSQTTTPRPAGDLAGLHQQLQALEKQQASIIAEIQRLREAERSVARDPDEEPAPSHTADNRLA